ncbi:hypothetical protein L7F22_007843 [Adiantum nelumboides]|nr:hypothetical protein [Adiantum nelumboides]
MAPCLHSRSRSRLSSSDNIESWAAHDYEAGSQRGTVGAMGTYAGAAATISRSKVGVREASRQAHIPGPKGIRGRCDDDAEPPSASAPLGRGQLRWPPPPLRCPEAAPSTQLDKCRRRYLEGQVASNGSRERLLVGCMHDGFKILNLPNDPASGDMDVMVRFDEHQTRLRLRLGPFSLRACSHVYSCSFYDSLLHIWEA